MARREEKQVDTGPASGSEDLFGSREEQKQQDEEGIYSDVTSLGRDEDAGADSRRENAPPTIVSSMDGVPCTSACVAEPTPEENVAEGANPAQTSCSTRRGSARSGGAEAPRSGVASGDSGEAAATREVSDTVDTADLESMEVTTRRTSEEGESEDYEEVKASKKRLSN